VCVFVLFSPELGEYKGSVDSFPQVLRVFSAVSRRFHLVLDTGGRLGGLEGKVSRSEW